MATKKRFLNNIGFYFLGTFSTKILQFLFIPLYSKFIVPEEMGFFSLVISVVALSLPLLFQSIWEGAFRFTIDDQDNERKVLSVSSRYCLSLVLTYSIIFLLCVYFLNIRYGLFILLYAVGQIGVSYWQFSARALKENKWYSISTVVNSAVTVVLNFILILYFKMGIEALFISSIAGSFSMIVILESRLRLLFDLGKYSFNRKLLKQIITYSLPLAVNMLSWWLMSSCNNIIIVSVLGESQNGIYAMALKFGNILVMFTSVITLAWQEEAFRTYGEKDSDKFFNEMFNLLAKSLLSVVLILIPVIFIAYNYMVFGEYKTGNVLVSFIFVSAIFNTLSCHLGSAFLARKESNIIFLFTLSGGIISVLFSVLFVYLLGLQGAVIATLLGNIFNMCIRIPYLKKRMDFKINIVPILVLSTLCLILGRICLLIEGEILYLCLVTLLSFTLFLFINKKILVSIQGKIRKKICKI